MYLMIVKRYFCIFLHNSIRWVQKKSIISVFFDKKPDKNRQSRCLTKPTILDLGLSLVFTVAILYLQVFVCNNIPNAKHLFDFLSDFIHVQQLTRKASRKRTTKLRLKNFQKLSVQTVLCGKLKD